MAETDSVMVFNLQYHLMTLAHYLVFVSHDSQAQEWGWLDLVVMINVSNSTDDADPHAALSRKAYRQARVCLYVDFHLCILFTTTSHI